MVLADPVTMYAVSVMVQDLICTSIFIIQFPRIWICKTFDIGDNTLAPYSLWGNNGITKLSILSSAAIYMKSALAQVQFLYTQFDVGPAKKNLRWYCNAPYIICKGLTNPDGNGVWKTPFAGYNLFKSFDIQTDKMDVKGNSVPHTFYPRRHCITV